MKCEHGKRITVLLAPLSPPWWDDGVRLYDKDGEVDVSGKYVLVRGCAQCKVVKVEEAE